MILETISLPPDICIQFGFGVKSVGWWLPTQVHPVLESNPGLILVSLNTCGNQQVQCYHRNKARSGSSSSAGLISLLSCGFDWPGWSLSLGSWFHTRVREDSDFRSLALIKLPAGQEFGERDRRGSCVIWVSCDHISLISHIATSTTLSDLLNSALSFLLEQVSVMGKYVSMTQWWWQNADWISPIMMECGGIFYFLRVVNKCLQIRTQGHTRSFVF